MSETKIIDTIKIDDIEASILGATISSGHGDGVSFGKSNTAGELSFATNKSTANGDYSHSEGFETEATGDYAHAEGHQTISEDIATHAEGYGTQATGIYSHTEGCETVTNGEASHAEGHETTAGGIASHAEGYGTNASSNYSHAEGQSTLTDGDASHAEGYLTKASGNHSHAEGDQTNANGNSSHAEGENTLAEGEGAHAEGEATYAGGSYSHAEGDETKTYGLASHAEGSGTTAYGDDAHAEGANTKAGGEASHTEGYNTKTATEFQYQILNKGEIIGPEDGYQGNYYITLYLNSIQGLSKGYEITFNTSNDYLNDSRSSINEINENNNSIIIYSQDQDGDTIKNTDFSTLTKAYLYIYNNPELGSVARNGAPYAHAEGNSTQALGEASHSEGKDTKATGNYSHASGIGTIASAEAQTVIGKYNIEDNNALFIVGNGTASTPSNAFIVKNDGTVIAKGKELTADTIIDNTIQDFKVSDDFIKENKNEQGTVINTTVERSQTTTFTYEYEGGGKQYLNPPLSKIIDASNLKNTEILQGTSVAANEYATTERWLGYPVYQAVIKLKGNTDYIDIPWTGNTNDIYTAIDSFGLVASSSGFTRNMPYEYWHIWGESYPTYNGVSGRNHCLRIRQNKNNGASGYTIIFTVKYIKVSPKIIFGLD